MMKIHWFKQKVIKQVVSYKSIHPNPSGHYILKYRAPKLLSHYFGSQNPSKWLAQHVHQVSIPPDRIFAGETEDTPPWLRSRPPHSWVPLWFAPVGGFSPTPLEDMIVKFFIISPGIWGKNKKTLYTYKTGCKLSIHPSQAWQLIFNFPLHFPPSHP